MNGTTATGTIAAAEAAEVLEVIDVRTAAPPRSWPGAACLVTIALGTLANQFWPQSGVVWLTGLAAALFLLIEHRRIPRSIRRVTLVVGGLSMLLLPFAAEPLPSLARGIAIGALMVSLVSSVSLLARAALESPYTRIVAQHLLASGMRSRYTWFSFAAQLFGGLLGMAGVTLLLQMAARGEVAADEDRLAMFAAITRSFSAATLWSPMVSNLTILLALYPGLSWSTVVPLTLALAAGSIVIGIALDQWRLRGRTAPPPADRPDSALAGALFPMLAAMGGFLVVVIGVAHALQIAVVGSIVIVIPFIALALHRLNAQGARRWRRAGGALRADVLALPGLAGEVALFMVAGCGGTIIAGAIPVAWTAAVGSALSHSAVLACLALMLAIIVLGFAAVHPVLSSVLVASSLPPSLVHLAPIPHLAAILVGWSVSSCATPFSMMALMASRYSGFSIYAVTVRANHVYAILCLAVAAVALGMVSVLMRAAF
ncbi:hypothetical protein [Variovorax sp. 770b2]|uniref:hypothetical protein n=1 Tax=Variovorax sp. 770b2 TaxID=1566271 RepID=UPI0008DEBDA3|nr:hypothetical protein [Variovorax sp. 770b2]SFP26347.1 hypothetical protein SAMN03159339_1295 [Variovorax sp. 770b2]